MKYIDEKANNLVERHRYSLIEGKVDSIENGRGYVIIKFWIGGSKEMCYVRVDEGMCKCNVFKGIGDERSISMEEARGLIRGSVIYIPVVIYSYMRHGINIPWVMKIDRPYICCYLMDDSMLRLYEEEWDNFIDCPVRWWVRDWLVGIAKKNCLHDEETDRLRRKEGEIKGCLEEEEKGRTLLKEFNRRVVREGDKEWEEITIRRGIK